MLHKRVNYPANGKVKLHQRKKLVKLFSALSILVVCTFNFAPTLLTGRCLEALRELYPVAKKWKDQKKTVEVPRLIHFLLLGKNPPEHFVKMVQFNTKVAKENGFDVIAWVEEDVDVLVKFHQYKFPGLEKSWKMMTAIEASAGVAIKADFVRDLVMWALGGVYLDADFIACNNVDFMVDAPGVISFPIMPQGTQGISSAAMSAPPHHRLFEILLEKYIDLVDSIDVNMAITIGETQYILAEAADEYFKEIGEEADFMDKLVMPSAAEPVTSDTNINEEGTNRNFQVTVADIRLRAEISRHNLYHLNVKSWLLGQEMKSICFDNPDLLIPFLEETCNSDLTNVNEIDFVNKCGYHKKRREEETRFNNTTVDDDFLFDYTEEARAWRAKADNPIYRRLKAVCEEYNDDFCPSFETLKLSD